MNNGARIRRIYKQGLEKDKRRIFTIKTSQWIFDKSL